MGDEPDPGRRRPSEAEPAAEDSFTRQLGRQIGPIASGALLDLVDLATFGAVGLSGGFAFGAMVGWILAVLNGVRGRRRLWIAVGAALYTAIPMTETLPLATIASVVLRLSKGGDAAKDEGPGAG